MLKHRRSLFVLILLPVSLLSALLFLLFQAAGKASEAEYTDCVVGLLPNKTAGSDLVIYPTETWDPVTILTLPDVTPDNDAAVSEDGRRIAYTTWDEGYIRRYLKVLDTSTGETHSFYRDTPPKTEVIDLSWMPDHKTLLCVVNDASQLFYKEIRLLDVENGTEETLVRGEVWKIGTSVEDGEEAPAFYLKGAERSVFVQEFEQDAAGGLAQGYYLTQDEVNQIYQFYGGQGEYDRAEILNYFYVIFSRPRVSEDGRRILYSATLQRNSARGEGTPLWICSAIWCYDLETRQSEILYAQTDGGAIGRVDWVGADRLTFVSYYDFTGGRDSIHLFDCTAGSCETVFPYTENHYNNVTLLPIGSNKFTFTSSPKNEVFERSQTMEYDLDTETAHQLMIQYQGKDVLLSQFLYTKMSPDALSKLQVESISVQMVDASE